MHGPSGPPRAARLGGTGTAGTEATRADPTGSRNTLIMEVVMEGHRDGCSSSQADRR